VGEAVGEEGGNVDDEPGSADTSRPITVLRTIQIRTSSKDRDQTFKYKVPSHRAGSPSTLEHGYIGTHGCCGLPNYCTIGQINELKGQMIRF
jgi:hypothetical protein